jgi:hypothetical protein
MKISDNLNPQPAQSFSMPGYNEKLGGLPALPDASSKAAWEIQTNM